jgi:8-oxo-dGTP diphosphatase
METKKMGIGFGILMLKNGMVLLGQRHSDAAKADSEMHGEGTWTFPGGKLHFGESFEEGAQREILEETGLKVELNDLKVISLTNDIVSDAHFVTVGLLCENFSGEPQVLEPDEITVWKWFPVSDLPSPIFLPSQKLLSNYLEEKFYKN